MPVSPNTIRINDGTNDRLYYIKGPVQMTSEQDLLPPAPIGMPEQGMQSKVWTVNFADLTGGLGIDVVDGRDPVNGYWSNVGWDTRFPNKLQLWPAATLITTITATVGPPTYNGRQGGLALLNQTTAEAYDIFAHYGDRIVRIADPTAASPTVTEVLDNVLRVVGLGTGHNTAVAPTGESILIYAEEVGGSANGWWTTIDRGATWQLWSPGGPGDDPDNENPFLAIPSTFELNWIHSTASDWIVEYNTVPNRTGALPRRTIDLAFLRPRFLGIGINSDGTPAPRWADNTPKRFEGIISDMPINALCCTSWFRRELYGYKKHILFVNPAMTPQILMPATRTRTIAGIHIPAEGIRERRRIAERLNEVSSPHESVSQWWSLDQGQGLPAIYEGFITAIKTRSDGAYFLLERGTGEFPVVDPAGTQITWLFEINAETMKAMPLARFYGAAAERDSLLVTESHIWVLIKTAALTANVYRVARSRSPGVRGTDNFEPFTLTAGQFTAANSEYLSVADNAALSMGDIDMSGHCWVRLDSTPASGATMGILGKWAAADLEYGLLVDNTGGTIRFQFRVRDTANTATTTVTATTFGTPSINAWYPIHFYHDATANTIGISVNNGTFNTASTTGGVRNGTAAFEIGRHTAGNYFDGRIGPVAIWKQRLTAAQFTYLYNSDLGQAYQNIYTALRTNLQAWWQLDETSGTRRDSQGTNHLTDNNTVTSAGGKSGPVARLELPWMHFGWPHDTGPLIYMKSTVGTFTNMTLRLSYQRDYDDSTEAVLGSLTAGGSIAFAADTTFTAVRLILEAWRSTGTTATDTLVLPDGIELGFLKLSGKRREFVAYIDQMATMMQRGGQISHGRLLTELHDLVNTMVNVIYDDATYSNFRVKSAKETALLDDPPKGREGTYQVILVEAALPT